MYRGIKLDHLSVRDYASALAALEQRASRRYRRKVNREDILRPGGAEVPLGHPRSQVTGARMLADRSIAFRLYRTDVVTWRPDNSVSIKNYGSATTTAFGNALLPYGVWLEAGGVIEFSGRVCRGYGATFHRTPEGWIPDEATCQELTIIRTDRRRAREVREKYHLKDFAIWLEVALPHYHQPLEHRKEDCGFAARCLLERDFRSAAAHLDAGHHWRIVTTGGYRQLCEWLYDREDALLTEQVKTLSYGQYRAQRARQRRLRQIGAR